MIELGWKWVAKPFDRLFCKSKVTFGIDAGKGVLWCWDRDRSNFPAIFEEAQLLQSLEDFVDACWVGHEPIERREGICIKAEMLPHWRPGFASQRVLAAQGWQDLLREPKRMPRPIANASCPTEWVRLLMGTQSVEAIPIELEDRSGNLRIAITQSRYQGSDSVMRYERRVALEVDDKLGRAFSRTCCGMCSGAA